MKSSYIILNPLALDQLCQSAIISYHYVPATEVGWSFFAGPMAEQSLPVFTEIDHLSHTAKVNWTMLFSFLKKFPTGSFNMGFDNGMFVINIPSTLKDYRDTGRSVLSFLLLEERDEGFGRDFFENALGQLQEPQLVPA